MLPQPMGEAVEQERLKPGIAQHDFEARTRRGIAGESGVYFVTQVFQKHRYHYVILALALLRGTASHRERLERRYNCPTNAIKNCGTDGGAHGLAISDRHSGI